MLRSRLFRIALDYLIIFFSGFFFPVWVLYFFSVFMVVLAFFAPVGLTACLVGFAGFHSFSISFGIFHAALQVIPHRTELINVLLCPVFVFRFFLWFLFPVFFPQPGTTAILVRTPRFFRFFCCFFFRFYFWPSLCVRWVRL